LASAAAQVLQLPFYRRKPFPQLIEGLPPSPPLVHQGGDVSFRPPRQIQGSRPLGPIHPFLPAANVLRQPQEALALEFRFRFQSQPIPAQLLLPFPGRLFRQQAFLLGIGLEEAFQSLLQTGLQLVEPVS
jgi:hypothetical protein